MVKKTEKRGPGRPPKPPGTVRELDLRIPVTADEKQQIVQAALAAGGNGEIATWVRGVVLDAVQRLQKKRSG